MLTQTPVKLDISENPRWRPGMLIRIDADYYLIISYTYDRPVNYGLGGPLPAAVYAYVRKLELGADEVLSPTQLAKAHMVEDAPRVPDCYESGTAQ